MKFLKRLLIVLIVLAGLFYFVGVPYLKNQTKKHSPEKTVTQTYGKDSLSVRYSSPSKKGRVVFGELVPYNRVWRTGANEPTTFTTSENIKIIDKTLLKGTYSLWTVPNKHSWKIIFNKEIPDWGVTILSGGEETARNPEQDILQVEVPVRTLPQPIENFTIEFENNISTSLSLSWDRVKVRVPIQK